MTSKSGRPNWTQVRAEYVSGTESYAQIADRLGVSVSSVKRHACGPKVDQIETECGANGGQTWGEMRRTWRLYRAAETLKAVSAAQVRASVDFALKSRTFGGNAHA